MGTELAFQFHLPTEIRFGAGKVKQLGNVLRDRGVKNAFVVTDPGVVKANLLEPVFQSLESAGITFSTYTEVEPDPSVETIDRAAEAFKQRESDAIIAVGGGSPMDTAKGIRVVVSNGGSIRDYAGVNKVQTGLDIPLVAVPTTSGTGSEVTIFGVYSDWEQNWKVTVTSPHMAPTLAVVDPEMTRTCPPHITAATGIDALAHAVETYVSKGSQPPSEALAEHAMKLIGRYLRRAVANGEDAAARENMSLASLMAGMAFNQSYLGLAHAIGSALSGHAHVSHGNAIALLLPAVMEYNVPAQVEKFKQIAVCLGERVDGLSDREAAARAVKAVLELRADTGLVTHLRDAGVTEEHLPLVAKDTAKSGMFRFNPRAITEEQVLALLRRIY